MVTLLVALIGLIGGYWLGVLRARSERRDEKRDEALAEIYKTLSLFYRSLMAWTGDPSRPPITEPETSARDYCLKRYSEFLETYYGNSIWLGKETDDLINAFVQASRDLINELVRDMDEEGRLPDGTSAVIRRERVLGPIEKEVRSALRAEIEASRQLFPYRVVVRTNGAQGR